MRFCPFPDRKVSSPIIWVPRFTASTRALGFFFCAAPTRSGTSTRPSFSVFCLLFRLCGRGFSASHQTGRPDDKKDRRYQDHRAAEKAAIVTALLVLLCFAFFCFLLSLERLRSYRRLIVPVVINPSRSSLPQEEPRRISSAPVLFFGECLISPSSSSEITTVFASLSTSLSLTKEPRDRSANA